VGDLEDIHIKPMELIGHVIRETLREQAASSENQFIHFAKDREKLDRKLKKLFPTQLETTIWNVLWSLSATQDGRLSYIEFTEVGLSDALKVEVYQLRDALRKFARHGLLKVE